MRIAYIVMTYKNPVQLHRLLSRLKHHDADFYIHLDKKTNDEEFRYLEKKRQVFFIQNRQLVNWGGFSLIRAVVSSITEVLNSGIKYDFINLLSAQDYPIKPTEHIHDFLQRNTGSSFITYNEFSNQDWWQAAIKRIEHYHFNDFSFKGRYVLQNVLNSYLPARKFPEKMKLFGNNCSSWWTLSQECAAFFIDFIREHSKLKRFLQYTWAPDEFIYATVIMNSPFRDKTFNNNLRYIDWSQGGARPKILKIEDYACLQQSDQFFARKFDTDYDSAILDKIDAAILNFQEAVPV